MNEIEMRRIVEEAGGIWAGIQERFGYGSDLILWHDPVTHNTLELAIEDFSPEAVKKHMMEKKFSKRKASVETAVAKLKDDMDRLETDIIQFKDIKWWCEKNGKEYGINDYEWEDVAKGLESKGVRVKY